MPNEFITQDQFLKEATEVAAEHGLDIRELFFKRPRPWRVISKRSLLNANLLVWRARHVDGLGFDALSLESVMQFIGRYERGEMK